MVEIVFSLNQQIWLSLVVAIQSIVQNAAHPEDVRFNILVPPGEESLFEDKIRTHLPDLPAQWRVKSYLPPQPIRDYLDNRFREKTQARRNSRYIQYARFYFKEAFSDLSKIIYLDTDLVVLGDIAELYAYTHQLNAECYFGSIPHTYPCIFYFSNPFKMWREIFKFKRTFNAGVWFTHLDYWQADTYERLAHYLRLDAANSYRLYTLGDEPVFNLMFKDYLQVERNWNRCGYGSPPIVTQLLLPKSDRFLSQAKLIHWSGPYKPWNTPDVQFASVWREYVPPTLQDQVPATAPSTASVH